MRYRFGEFIVDTDSYALSRGDRVIPVRPKVFDVLRYLIEHRDRVVPKAELLEALWPEQHVDAFGVPWSVSHVRRALDQSRGAQEPVQTVHGRGYRFSAEVTVLAADAAEVTVAPALPAQPRSAAPDPFVGRALLMQQLEMRLAQAKAGAGSCCVFVGEAGIGKTRCMDELATRARAAGFFVWTGRSLEAAYGPVFWPWIQILRMLQKDLPQLAEKGQPLIARLMAGLEPSSAEGKDAGEVAPASAMESGRYWLYEAIGGVLREAAQHGPVMLALDDLHWADAGSWELLAFIAPELRRLPILVVGTRRDDRRALARQPRSQSIRDMDRLVVAPLGVPDVQEYVRLVTGLAQPSATLCEAVQAVSMGNPWFLKETLSALLVEHGADALAGLEPQAVQPTASAVDQLRSRLNALEPEVGATLCAAAVLGERFDLALLSRAAGLPLERVLMAVDVACEEGLVSLEPPQHARFCHGLLRSVLYEAIAVPARLRLHFDAAVALEETLDPLHYGDIAYHYHRSLPLPDPERAVAAASRAASAAARTEAFVDAALFLEWAGHAQGNDPRVTSRERAELCLRRAAMERMAGRDAQARASAKNAIDLAREQDDRDLLVRAARILRFSLGLGSIPDPLALSALEAALRGDTDHATATRVSALSLMSWLPPHALDMERSKALSAEALTLARELASPAALRDAFHARLHALSGPDDIDALLSSAEELLAVPGERPHWVGVEALLASYRAHLYRCDLEAADVSLALLGREAEQHGLSEIVWYHDFFRAQRVFSTGDFATSETMFAELAERGARLNLAQVPLLSSVAKALLSNERDGMAALEHGHGVDAMLAGLLALPACYAATGARLAAELGRLPLARQLLHQHAQHDFAVIPKDLGYVNALANLSVVAVVLCDKPRCQALYERLAPYAHHNTPNGAVGFFEGSAARFLAGLAAALGEAVRAEGHFQDAIAQNERLGALPQVARTSYEYARWLLQQERKAAALPRTQRAIDIAEQLGMRALARDTRALLERSGA